MDIWINSECRVPVTRFNPSRLSLFSVDYIYIINKFWPLQKNLPVYNATNHRKCMIFILFKKLPTSHAVRYFWRKKLIIKFLTIHEYKRKTTHNKLKHSLGMFVYRKMLTFAPRKRLNILITDWFSCTFLGFYII